MRENPEPVGLPTVKVDAASDASPQDAVERVWREHGPKLWRSLTAFTGDADLASDAMAEAFAQALGRGNDIHQADRWIWRSAFLIAKGELKRRRTTDCPRWTTTHPPPSPCRNRWPTSLPP